MCGAHGDLQTLLRSTEPSALFVCDHNAGRSPMAAGFLTHLAGDQTEVRSAGSAPAETINFVPLRLVRDDIPARVTRLAVRHRRHRTHHPAPPTARVVYRLPQRGQGRAASCLSPLAGLDKQRTIYAAAVAALAAWCWSPGAADTEIARIHLELADGITHQHVVINGVLPPADGDVVDAETHHREQATLTALPAQLRALPLDEVELKAADMVGIGVLDFSSRGSAELTLREAGAAPAGSERAADRPRRRTRR
ncbi:hypothetical protein O4328_36860 [Rhodococcus opacus]|uniref:Protein-tyrosine-phosphatase n=1 Tax=Rhodococcus opacus TaxID=37919 RepID=A0ABT4NP48_RHOOP|nr:hypothetical protein [Rhodococcus opacus]MCZ4589160.1 hypothetical protein [Rhodococcus opacus]